MGNYGQQLWVLVTKASRDTGNEDIAEVLANMIEEAGFDYEVYVQLPQMMESVLEGASEQRNDSLMAEEYEANHYGEDADDSDKQEYNDDYYGDGDEAWQR